VLPVEGLHPFHPEGLAVIFTDRSAQNAFAGGVELAPATPSHVATASRSSLRMGPATFCMMPKSSVR
jgi:hypothetical protein